MVLLRSTAVLYAAYLLISSHAVALPQRNNRNGGQRQTAQQRAARVPQGTANHALSPSSNSPASRNLPRHRRRRDSRQNRNSQVHPIHLPLPPTNSPHQKTNSPNPQRYPPPLPHRRPGLAIHHHLLRPR